MRQILQKTHPGRILGLALLSALFLTLLLPSVASAHAILPGTNPTSGDGTLDGPGFFNLIVITLVELGGIFWVGAQLWVNFVLETSSEKHQEEAHLNRQIERRFEQRFSLPTLGLLLLANLGVLYGRVLTATGNWSSAFSFTLLQGQFTSGGFGTYWLLRMIVLLLALLIALYMQLSKKRPPALKQVIPLLNLFLGAMFFIALTMSGDAAGVSGVLLPYSVVIDWLHLLAAALWVGGMIYILLIYLPTLQKRALLERSRSLLVILTQYSPLAIVGVILLAITGPLSATFHLNAFAQFFTTAYGRTLLVKTLLLCALLATSAYHVFWLRPRMKKEYQKYNYIKGRLDTVLASAEETATAEATTEPPRGTGLLSRQVKLREERLAKKTTQLISVLRWEPWLGVAVILCVGLLNVFSPALALSNTQQPAPTTPVAKPFNGSVKTSDGKYTVALNINPNRFGTNVFTVEVTDASTGKTLGANEVSVTLFTTMLDMAMGTDSVSLPPDGKGGFSGSQDLVMSGDWGIEIQLRTPDQTLHEANFKITTPF